MDLKDHIRKVPDFPKPGILFYDISTLLMQPQAWRTTVERLAEEIAPYKPDLLVGIESRGFLTAAPLALHMELGFFMEIGRASCRERVCTLVDARWSNTKTTKITALNAQA